MKGTFNNRKFYAALDAERAVRTLTWKQVAEESGVSASTLTRMAQGKRPDVDGLAALLTWAGLDSDSFLDDADREGPDSFTRMTMLLHGDQRISSENKVMLEGILRAVYGSVLDER